MGEHDLKVLSTCHLFIQQERPLYEPALDVVECSQRNHVARYRGREEAWGKYCPLLGWLTNPPSVQEYRYDGELAFYGPGCVQKAKKAARLVREYADSIGHPYEFSA